MTHLIIRQYGSTTYRERAQLRIVSGGTLVAGAALAHASTHVTGGSDEVDGDKLDIDWTPSNYTPTTSPSEADNVDNLTAHLAGIDAALATASGTPGGSNTEIQFNDGGAFNGIAAFTTDGTDITATGLLNLSSGTLRIPTSSTPTVSVNGDIALDTDAGSGTWSTGVIRYYAGEEMFLVGMPIAQLTNPTDGYVVAYNATNDEFELVAQSAAGTPGGSG